MATALEELQKMMSSMRTPGASRTKSMAPGSVSGTNKAGAAVDLEFSGGDPAGLRRPGLTAGRSSVPTTNPAERVARANRIMETPAQASRTSTEAALNPEVGEALRLSLIEQQRVSGPTYGSMGAFERRDRREAQASAQAAVDSGLAALQGIRQGGIDERGQNLATVGALEDRQMQEAGAFDRALLGLDDSMLRGQFGLAGIDAEAEGRRDPATMFGLDVLATRLNREGATEADQDNAVNAAFKLAAIPGASTGPTFTAGPTGLEVTGTANQLQDPDNVLLASRALPPGDRPAFFEAQGYVANPDGTLKPMAQQTKEREDQRKLREQQLQQQLQDRQAAVAAYLRNNPVDPSIRLNAINNQSR